MSISTKSVGKFYSGTSGLVLPVPKALYPEEFKDKSRLTYYASLFNSVEINSSFYKIPRPATVINWAESVGEHFRFTFKLSKTITHAKGLAFAMEDVGDFMQVADHIGLQKGCLLIQFPPSIKIEMLRQVEHLLATTQKHNIKNEWKIAIEFRNSSWYNDEVNTMLEKYNTALVIHDLPASTTPVTQSISNIKYLRFHGPGGRYRGSYTDDFLLEYAGYIKQWLSNGDDVYCYFNNTMGDAVKNLATLNSMVDPG